ncbi:RecQ family zinc-binding domain-containing protein [Mesobacillus subterraneus]|uniref:RecQ family zinc-binding domain-containing protein n=1 Tax=Mesobacillus subterraneus TaxID=285983 RepID=UPI0035323FEC
MMDKQSLLRLIENRLEVKNTKIKKMLGWINTKECKRKVILEMFGEEVQERPQNCCISCGIELDYFKETDPSSEQSLAAMDWKQELASILLMRERI